MKLIPVGYMVAVVDDQDFEYLNQFRWFIVRGNRTVYAARQGPNGKHIRMHREIVIAKEVDHRNGDGLDNRRSNLRPATRRQNVANTRKASGKYSSEFKGVTWDKGKKKWRAQIKSESKALYLGAFVTEREAALAYNKAALAIFGEFALLNEVK